MFRKKADEIILRFGDYKRSLDEDATEYYPHYKTRGVRDIVIHPKYNRFTYDNDIALLYLSKPIDFNDEIRPICVPEAEGEGEFHGKIGYITGWGTVYESKLRKKQ